MIKYESFPERWVAICDLDTCDFVRAYNSQIEATVAHDTHNCPYIGGTRHYAWDITVTLVEQLWVMLDAQYENLVMLQEAKYPDDMIHNARGQLRGVANATALFMKPHFQTGDDIAVEVVKRHDMKQAGERYETVGLGSRIYEGPPRERDKYALVQQTVTPANVLVDPVIEARVRGAHKSGISKSDLAEMFKLPAVTIAGIINA